MIAASSLFRYVAATNGIIARTHFVSVITIAIAAGTHAIADFSIRLVAPCLDGFAGAGVGSFRPREG